MQASDFTDSIYVTADGGAIFQQVGRMRQSTPPTTSVTYKPGYRGDLSVGYNFTPSLAAEFQFGIMHNDVNSVGNHLSPLGQSLDFTSVPLLLNVIYKIPVKGRWVPYVGVGAGGNISRVHYGVGTTDDHSTDAEPAVQGELGLKYNVSDRASFGLAYKFMGTLNEHYNLRSVDDKITVDGIYIHGVFANFTVSF